MESEKPAPRAADAPLNADDDDAQRSTDAPLGAPHVAPGPLSADDLAQFVRDGYCLLPGAFPRDVAFDCRDALWRRVGDLGIAADDPATWSLAPKGRLGLQDVFRESDLGAVGECWSDRLRAALDQLCGAGRWVDDDALGCGWWVVTFPGVANAPWGAEGSWHVDGHGYAHRVDSREIGVLPIFLFSDVAARGGGTALAPGSHRAVAELLWRAGAEGVPGPRLSALAREALGAEALAGDAVVETRGRAGDVMLTHPSSCTRSKNLRDVDAAAVRFMCHPAVRLAAPMRVADDGGAPSPVEAPPGGGKRDAAAAQEAELVAAMGFGSFKKRRR
ncbi:hypothetical protein JL720_3140 [Aureococcus anophagefferens]|nr:hypothetical protein JL720_3140 [Aureococcus anophagefferens]